MKLFNKIAFIAAGATLAIGGGAIAASTGNAVAAKAATEQITLSKDGGTNTYDATIAIEGSSYTGVKAGTGSKAGVVKVTLPAKTTTFGFYAAGWTKVSVTIGLSTAAEGVSFGTSSFALTNDTGVSGNGPTYTFSTGAVEDTFECVSSVSGVGDSPVDILVTATAGLRFVIWGASAQTSASASELTGVTLDKTFDVVSVGGTTTLTAGATPGTAQDVTYEWATDNAAIATVSNSGVVTGVSAGVANITVTAKQGASTSFSKSCKVVVAAHAGTAADPLNATDANAVATATGTTATSAQYYVGGEVTSFTVSSGQATAFVTDGTATFQLYKFKDIGNANFVDTTKVRVGDTIVVKTAIINYGGNTPEGQYGELISIESDVTLSSVEIRGNITTSVCVGEDFNIGELSIYAIYSDSSEIDVTNSATITVNPQTATAVGTTTITVSASYQGINATSRQFNVTVTEVVATVTDTITAATFSPTNTSYAYTDNAKATSSALYGAYTAKSSAGGVQMNNTPGGIFVKRTGGKRVKSITLVADSGKTCSANIYGSNTPYAKGDKGAEALWSDGTAGTLIGESVGAGTFAVPGNYQYIGIRKGTGSNANYWARIEIVWEQYTAAEIVAEISTLAGGWSNNVATEQCSNKYAHAKEIILTLSAEELATLKTSTDSDFVAARAAYETWCDRNGDVNPYEGEIVSAMNNSVSSNENSGLAIAIVSVTSLIALVGAYFLLKKKKVA